MVPLYEGLAKVLGLGIPARRGRVPAALDSLADDVEAVVKVLLAVVARECGVEIGVAAFDPVLRCGSWLGGRGPYFRGWALEEEVLENGMLTYHTMEFMEDAQGGEISAVFELGRVVAQLSEVFHFFFRDTHRAHYKRGDQRSS